MNPDSQARPSRLGMALAVALLAQAAGLLTPLSSSAARRPDPEKHWSFQPLSHPSVPETSNLKSQISNPLDVFIRAKLADANLASSPRADRRTLIRRLFLDLQGLPPTPEQIAAFEQSADPLAWESLVDEALASPRYGERWAQRWLDVVRYADTHGYEVNTPRESAWPYRDYVIRAFNDDKPYNRFVYEQLAGDTVGEDPATGFLVAAAVLLPGQIGKDDASKRLARHDSLDEMIIGTSETFLGLTVGCARCHNHKFDPISQEDYYAMQAFFAGVDYGDRKMQSPEYEARIQKAKTLEPRLSAARAKANAEAMAKEASSKKNEEAARLKAAAAANAAAADANALTPKVAKKRRSSLSDIKAQELMGSQGPRAIILTSSIGGSTVESKERRIKDMFLAFKVCHEVLDGASADNKERRNMLFGVSGVRGNYPQVFAVGKDETMVVSVGQIEDVEELADNQKANNTPSLNTTFTFAVEGFTERAPAPAAPAPAAPAPASGGFGGGGSSGGGDDILSDPKFLALLTKVTSQLESLEVKVASGWRGGFKGGGGGSGGGDNEENEGPKPSVVAFDALLSDKVASFVAACKGADLSDMGDVATAAYQGMRSFIDMASQCFKPGEMSEQQALAKPMIDQIRKAGSCKNDARRTPTEYHWNSFTEALSSSLSWTLTSGVPGVPPPYKAIQECAIDGAMFYVNKVRKEHKGEAAHDTWVKSLLQMLNAIRDYAKEFHKAGLTWSFKAQGAKSCSEYVGSSAAAPATAPAAAKAKADPTPAATKAEDGAATAARNRSALFAQLGKIDQSSGKTAGLRSVKKDANGKKFVEDDKANKMTAAKKARLAKMRGGAGGSAGGAAKKAAKTVRPPVKELRGKKWAIENQPKGSVLQLGEHECSIKQTVYIYNCEGATIQINGKVNTVTVDKCKKTNVIFNNLMGGCELVNCKSVKVQANGACPTVAVDKTDGVVIYAGDACYKTLTVVASKSSEMNISWPGPTADDAWLEACIPEQYQHSIDESGKVTCGVSDLYSH